MFKLNEELEQEQNISIKAIIFPLDIIPNQRNIRSSEQIQMYQAALSSRQNEKFCKPYSYISNIIFLCITKKKPNLSNVVVSFLSKDSNVQFEPLDNLNQPLFVKNEPTAYVRIKYFSSSPPSSEERLVIRIKYNLEGKLKEFESCLCFQTSNPLTIESYSTSKIGSVGIYANIKILNQMNVPAYDVRIKFLRSKYFIPFENDQDLIIPMINGGDVYSIVFRFRYSTSFFNEVHYKCSEIAHTIPIGSISLLFSFVEKAKDPFYDPKKIYEIHFIDFFNLTLEMADFYVQNNNGRYEYFPLRLESVSSPQIVHVMTAFPIEFTFESLKQINDESEFSFTLDIDTGKPEGLVPLGDHSFKTVVKNETTFHFSVMLIALKEGLLPFPDFVISLENGLMKRFKNTGGVFAVQDASIYDKLLV